MSWESYKLLDCWSYVQHDLCSEIKGFGASGYDCEAIIEIAVLMGATCENNRQKYEDLGASLREAVRALSKDVKERNKLMRLANYLMQKSRNFYTTR